MLTKISSFGPLYYSDIFFVIFRITIKKTIGQKQSGVQQQQNLYIPNLSLNLLLECNMKNFRILVFKCFYNNFILSVQIRYDYFYAHVL